MPGIFSGNVSMEKCKLGLFNGKMQMNYASMIPNAL